MTSRRSMLKWIPAACVGGWAGLFGKAAAAATTAHTPASDKLKAHQYESPIKIDRAAGTYTYTYTQYDADGSLLQSWSDSVVTHWEYPMP